MVSQRNRSDFEAAGFSMSPTVRRCQSMKIVVRKIEPVKSTQWPDS